MILQKHAQTLNLYRAAFDPFLVFLAWMTAFVVRFQSGFIALLKPTDSFDNYLRVSPVVVLSYVLVFWSTGLYRVTLERRRVWQEHFDVIRAHALAFLVFVTLTYFLFDHRYSRVSLVVFFAIVPVFVATGRSLIRKLNRAFLVWRSAKLKALVVGGGAAAARACDLIKERPDWMVEVADVVRAEDTAAIRRHLEQDAIDVVFIATTAEEARCVPDIVMSLGNTLAEILLLPDFGAPVFLTPRLLDLDGVPAIVLNTSGLAGFGAVQKRLFDIMFSGAFLLVFSPLFFVLAILVKATSPGPVFYRQERMGLDGKVFACLKFRGMVEGAEAATGPVWARKDDDRTTALGKWLRKTSLDEIPQFINVLKGDMSVVGPRPERPVFVSDFRHKIPGYMLRHKVRAGVTGWAQVNGWRGNTSLERRIECDLWYIQNWSLWLDLKICLLTPLKLFHPNAY